MKLSRYDAGAAVVYVSLLIASINVLGGCSAGSVEERASANATSSSVAEDEKTLALRQRATEFGDLLERLQKMSRDEAYYELQFYGRRRRYAPNTSASSQWHLPVMRPR